MDRSTTITPTNFKSKDNNPPATTYSKFRMELTVVGGSQVRKFDPTPSTRNSGILDLNNCVKSIDSKDSLEQFLAKLLDFYTNVVGLDCEETIISMLSLLDYLARCRGKFLIPWTATTITKVLLQRLSSSSNRSLTIQIYCNRIISSMVNSMADPSCCVRREQNSQAALALISRVLIRFLLGKGNSVSVGSAILFRALVATEAWKYASNDMVNEVYFRIALLLEKKETSTPFHLNLLCCLIKRSGLMPATPYMRSMLNSAAHILVDDSDEKRFCAVEMINSILKFANIDALLPEVLKCIWVIKRFTGSDQCHAIGDVCKDTIMQFEISTSLSDLSFAKDSMVNQREEEQIFGISSPGTWVSSYPPFDPHFCIGDCCLGLDTRKNSCLVPAAKIPAEPQTCKNMLDLVRMTRVSKENYHCSNSQKLISQPSGDNWTGSSSLDESSNPEITEQPVSEKAKTNGGLFKQIRMRASSRSGKIIGGLVGLGFAVGAAMVVFKALRN